MGADFSNHQCFVGKYDPIKMRSAIINQVQSLMIDTGCKQVALEDQGTRSFVIGPPERWIWVGDSAGSTEANDRHSFTLLSLGLSKLLPVVDILMSDSAAVQFYLYLDEKLIDKYGNARFPFYKFTIEEAVDFRGEPQRWVPYLLEHSKSEKLRLVWSAQYQANEILSQTMKLLGMNPMFYYAGYTWDDEGLPTKYDEFLSDDVDDFSNFDELHFCTV